MTHHVRFSAVLLFAAATPFAAQETQPAPEASPSLGVSVDKVVAKVNRKVVTHSDLVKSIGAAAGRLKGKELEGALERARLSLVKAQVERDAAEQVGLRIPKRFVEEQIERQKESAYLRGDSFKDVLAEENASEQEFREELTARIERDTYVAATAGGLRAAQFRPDYWPDPTAVDIRTYYRHNREGEFTIKNRARLYAIALPYSQFPSDAGRPIDERARQVAEIIREKLATGADFATMARQYSRSPEFKPEQGGDLGWIDSEKSPYTPLLVKFAFEGAVRTLSEPLPYPRPESARSILLLWVDERVEKRVVGFEEAQGAIRDQLRSRRLDVARRRVEYKLLEEAYIWPPQLKQQLLAIYR